MKQVRGLQSAPTIPISKTDWPPILKSTLNYANRLMIQRTAVWPLKLWRADFVFGWPNHTARNGGQWQANLRGSRTIICVTTRPKGTDENAYDKRRENYSRGSWIGYTKRYACANSRPPFSSEGNSLCKKPKILERLGNRITAGTRVTHLRRRIRLPNCWINTLTICFTNKIS